MNLFKLKEEKHHTTFIGRVLLCNVHIFYSNKAICQIFGPQLCKGIPKYIEYTTTQGG